MTDNEQKKHKYIKKLSEKIYVEKMLQFRVDELLELQNEVIKRINEVLNKINIEKLAI